MEDKIVIEVNKIKKLFPDIKIGIIYNSLSVTLTHFILKEKNFNKGFGSSHDPLLALQKAYSEFIERKTMFSLQKLFSEFSTSNGFAAHSICSEAKRNSRLELIERDSFLMCWHAKLAPYWISESDILGLLFQQNIEIYRTHLSLGLSVLLGIVSYTEGYITAIVCVRTKEGFFYIDCKAGLEIKALFNSLLESISFHSHYLQLGYLKHIRKKSYLTHPMDHFNYHLTHRNDLKWFFKGNKDVISLSTGNMQTYDCNPHLLFEIPFKNRYVFFSECLEYQNYYCGRINSKKINQDRYVKIFNTTVIKNFIPHPLS